MSETRAVNLNPLIWKLSLLTSTFYCGVSGGMIGAYPTTYPNVSQQNQYIAQVETKETTPAQTNTEVTTPEEPPKQPTETSNPLEKDIIAELNRVRTNPQEYADWLESQKQYYQGMLLKLPGEQPIRTNRGLRSLEEAISFLRQQDTLPPLSTSTELTSSAQQQIAAITSNQRVNNRNNLVYGKVTPEAIVMQLVVDDGFPDRRHRRAIFNRNYQDAGIVCSEIPVYNNVCAIAYTEETAEIAQKPAATNPSSNTNTTKPETKPETSVVANSNRLPVPPDINTPVTPESEVTATTETEANNQTTSTPETETPSESEAIATTEKPSDTTVETPESEVIATTETEENNQTASTPETETPLESEAIATTEKPSETTVETPESEVTATTESPTETDSEIASTSNVNPSPEAVEIVERGKLEAGDDVIPNDGSFYDSYPLDGSAGDSFTITLESQDFDTFLAIMDREGNIIEQNDDVNEQESNSRLEITLPDNGTYSVIVNAYEQGGKGNYILTVLKP